MRRNIGLFVTLGNHQQIAPPPQPVALTRAVSTRPFLRLPPQFRALVADPRQFGHRVRTRDVEAGTDRRHQGHPAVRRMHGQVHVLHLATRQFDGDVAELNSGPPQ